jgi:hypothetical protein
MVLLSFSRYCFFLRCCFFFHPTILLIVLLLSFSPCYCFSSRCLAFVFALLFLFDCSSILSIRFFVLLFSSLRYSAFLTMPLLLVCCYLLKILVLPPGIFSCRNWEWLGVDN